MQFGGAENSVRSWELNPDQLAGRQLCYHYTTVPLLVLFHACHIGTECFHSIGLPISNLLLEVLFASDAKETFPGKL